MDSDREWEKGRRAALVDMLRHIVRSLCPTQIGGAAQLIEREDSIAVLRRVCEEYGDNDWSEDLHLADIIEKHLERHLGG